jgi:ABC-2 type transport system ATP-binding protein
MPVLIEAAHLHKRFGGALAVDDLSLSVAAGEIFGLVGPDGAGKTTTIRLLCAALRPSAPEKDAPPTHIQLAGHDVLRQPEAARASLGYLPQRFSLYEELTVLENLRFFAEVRGLKTAEWQPRCLEILKFVGLADFSQRRAGQLSGGMKQKLGLAAALVHRPPVLLLDEPTTGVDPVTRQDFWQLIIRLVGQEGVAVLVSTPYMDEAARCNRVGFMRQGQMLVEGTPDALRRHLEGRILELRNGPLPELRRLAAADAAVEDVQMFGDRLHLRVQAGQLQLVMARLGERVQAELGAEAHLRPVAPQLEDVFIALLEAHEKDLTAESAEKILTLRPPQ